MVMSIGLVVAIGVRWSRRRVTVAQANDDKSSASNNDEYMVGNGNEQE